MHVETGVADERIVAVLAEQLVVTTLTYQRFFFFSSYGDHRDLHTAIHSFPTRRSSDLIVPATASFRLRWPTTLFSHVGALASSKSAMKTLAPELSPLIIILRSTGPVISTRRSRRSGGMGATVHASSRIAFVSGRKSGSLPASSSAWRRRRRSSSSRRRGSKPCASAARKSRARALRMSSHPDGGGLRSWMVESIAGMWKVPEAGLT